MPLSYMSRKILIHLLQTHLPHISCVFTRNVFPSLSKPSTKITKFSTCKPQVEYIVEIYPGVVYIDEYFRDKFFMNSMQKLKKKRTYIWEFVY